MIGSVAFLIIWFTGLIMVFQCISSRFRRFLADDGDSLPAVDSVTVDNHLAARKAGEHLVAQGCRRVAIVAGPVQTTTGASRLAGYRAALRAADRATDPSLVAYADFRTEGGYVATRQLLQQRQPPDGLLFANNLMTVGGLQAIAEAGLAIPGDIAVVAFDDDTWATAVTPPLTVVAQPAYQIGQTAAQLLLRRVGGEKSPPRHVVLRSELIVRASSQRTADSQCRAERSQGG
jgi:DNA-binding LacI/PurR family transcriptional regulator